MEGVFVVSFCFDTIWEFEEMLIWLNGNALYMATLCFQ